MKNIIALIQQWLRSYTISFNNVISILLLLIECHICLDLHSIFLYKLLLLTSHLISSHQILQSNYSVYIDISQSIRLLLDQFLSSIADYTVMYQLNKFSPALHQAHSIHNYPRSWDGNERSPEVKALSCSSERLWMYEIGRKAVELHNFPMIWIGNIQIST